MDLLVGTVNFNSLEQAVRMNRQYRKQPLKQGQLQLGRCQEDPVGALSARRTEVLGSTARGFGLLPVLACDQRCQESYGNV